MPKKRTQVVISGAGPAGSVMAYCLANQGIDVTVLEKNATCYEDLRASTFHPPTLEMLDQMGIAEELIEQGLRAPIYQYRNRPTGERIEFDLTELSDMTKFPYRLQCEQYKLARLLSRLVDEKAGCDVRFSSQLLSFEQHSDGVTVHAETPTEIDTYEADYLIAADGASSTIRKWLGIEFEGFTYPENFLCLSTEWPIEEHFEGLQYVNYVADATEWLVLLRVPTLWRVLIPASADATDQELRRDEVKNDVFERLVGNGEAVKTAHRTVYRVHQRIAKEFYRGRVALIGDAAHLNNPLGGFGMNSGVHDAWNLADKLTSIIKEGTEPEAALSHYDRQRRTATREFVQAQTISNKKQMEMSAKEWQRSAQREMQETVEDDEKRRAFLLRQSMFQSLEHASQIA